MQNPALFSLVLPVNICDVHSGSASASLLVFFSNEGLLWVLESHLSTCSLREMISEIESGSVKCTVPSAIPVVQGSDTEKHPLRMERETKETEPRRSNRDYNVRPRVYSTYMSMIISKAVSHSLAVDSRQRWSSFL